MDIDQPDAERVFVGDALARRVVDEHVAAQSVSSEATRQLDSPKPGERNVMGGYPALGHQRDGCKLLGSEGRGASIARVPVLLDPDVLEQVDKCFVRHLLEEKDVGDFGISDDLQECRDARFRKRCVRVYVPGDEVEGP